MTTIPTYDPASRQIVKDSSVPADLPSVWPACPDCDGPTRQAFATTRAYVTCRRCGHVHAVSA